MTDKITPYDHGVAPVGIVSDMPIDAYHAHYFMSSSRLRLAQKSIAHMFVEQSETAAMRLGTLFHTLVLEPETLERDYCWTLPTPLKPEGIDLRTTEGKAWKNSEEGQAWQYECEQVAAHNEEAKASNRRLVSLAELDRAGKMKEALEKNSHWQSIKDRYTHRELSMFAQAGEAFEFGSRCRFDLFGGALVGDLKSTIDASPAGFARSAAKFGYHIQEAFYSKVYEALFGHPPAEFLFIAVESKPPYGVGFYVLDAESKWAGNAALDKLASDYATYLQSGNATPPCYYADTLEIGLPRWAIYEASAGFEMVDGDPDEEDDNTLSFHDVF